MNYFKGLFIIPLIYISACSAIVDSSGPDDLKKLQPVLVMVVPVV